MESHELDDPAAAEAELATLQAQRSALAERAATAPWWYDALLSLLLFAFISSYALHDTRVTLVVAAVFLLCLRGMIALYRRLTGFWVNGFRKGPTRLAVVVWVAAVLAVLGAGFAADGLLGWTAAMPVAGAVLAVALFLVNRWWVRIYVSELRAER